MMNRRSFLAGLIGLAATPLIKPKRSLFFFDACPWRVNTSDIKFYQYPPMIDQNTGVMMRGVVHVNHMMRGSIKIYHGLYGFATEITKDNINEKKRDITRVINEYMAKNNVQIIKQC